jgi:hypothetical protein
LCAVYHYTTQLGPKFLGLVPYLILVAWFMLSYPSFVIADWLVPSGWKRWQRVLAVAAVGGLVMTASAPSSSPHSFSMAGMPPPPTTGLLDDCPGILIAMPLCRFFIHEGSDRLGRIHEGRVIFIHPGPGDNRRSLILHAAPLEFSSFLTDQCISYHGNNGQSWSRCSAHFFLLEIGRVNSGKSYNN